MTQAVEGWKWVLLLLEMDASRRDNDWTIGTSIGWKEGGSVGKDRMVGEGPEDDEVREWCDAMDDLRS
jgi:hypothetical protein